MPDIAIGNSASWDGNTANAATIATNLGSNYASASSGALTLKNGVSWNNNDSNNPFVSRAGSSSLDIIGGASVTSNTQGPLTVSGGALGAAVTVSSGVYLWSDDTADAALVITASCTVTNSGYIIGKGGDIGTGGYQYAGGDGGDAIEIQSGVSGVTITNNSGGYIAGGGGGGDGGAAGGGAGGGDGKSGQDFGYPTAGAKGYGGAIGQSGTSGGTGSAGAGGGGGGGAGGGGGGYIAFGAGLPNQTGGGGGGGRVLPGTGGAGGYGNPSQYYGGTGGSAGGLSSPTTRNGGGGWGAIGGTGNFGGGAGGAAINDNGVTYTLTNNGTIYGST